MKKIFSIQFVLLLVVAAAGFAVAGWQYAAHQQPTAPIAASQSSPAARTPDVQFQQLLPHPPVEPTLFQQEQAVRLALRQGDFTSAQRQMAAKLAQTHMGRWHFAPFAGYIEAVALPSDNQLVARIDAWAKAIPSSALAHLVRASSHFQLGWRVRGNGFAEQVSDARFKRFAQEVALADQEVQRSIQLDPDDPYARYLALLIARDSQDANNLEATFEAGVKRFPLYYPLYFVRLETLQPKWYGSVADMKAFVARYTGNASADSPLQMLHLELFADLLGQASQYCRDDQHPEDDRKACVDAVMERSGGTAMAAAAQQVVARFAGRDQLDANSEITDIIDGMIWTSGADAYAAAFLQFMATALDSDTQLVTSHAGGNIYQVDELAGDVWRHQQFYENAVTLYQRALTDLANTHFADAAAANEARAQVYDDLVMTYSAWHQPLRLLPYGEAAAKLQGGYGSDNGRDWQICDTLFQLKRYAEALSVCSASLAATGDLSTQFERAQIFEAMQQHDKAIVDFLAVLASPSAWKELKISAAIDASVSYDLLKQYQQSLALLSGQIALFPQDKSSDPSDLAIYYNNLCYNRMQLGKLQAALNDCTTSLQYGNLPDAISKQQRLINLLKQQPKTHPT